MNNCHAGTPVDPAAPVQPRHQHRMTVAQLQAAARACDLRAAELRRAASEYGWLLHRVRQRECHRLAGIEDVRAATFREAATGARAV